MSFDWAAGGLVATPRECARIMRGLVDGTLITPESWAFLAEPRSRIRYGQQYGASVWTLRMRQLAPVSGRLPDPRGALGVTATHLWHVPELDAEIVLNAHSTREMRASFVPLVAMLRGLADAHGGAGVERRPASVARRSDASPRF